MAINTESPASVVEVPLREVTVEFRFPGDARIPTWRGELQQLIRPDYPKLFVPQTKTGEAPAMQHYRFANETGTKFVDLAIHSLAVVSKEYPGWGPFRDEALKYWSLLQTGLSVQKLTRLGLRYVNHFAAIPALTPGHRALYGVLGDHPRVHRSVTLVETDDCRLIVNLEVPESGSPVTLDLDAYRGEIPGADAGTVLDLLHVVVEMEFVSVAGTELVSRLGIGPRG